MTDRGAEFRAWVIRRGEEMLLTALASMRKRELNSQLFKTFLPLRYN